MNQIDLAGKTAIVTGGANGLGLAITRRLLESGAAVAVWDLNSDGLADQPAGTKLTFHPVDVRAENDIYSAVKAVEASWGDIDILVNNAGIGGPYGPFQDVSTSDWNNVFAVNVTGTFLCCRAVVPLMLQRKSGRVINIASVAGKDGNANVAPYSATKGAVIALTKSLGKELAMSGITVNCVTPAAIETAILANRSKEHVQKMVGKIPMGRFGLPEELAAMVSWICSADASFSTGAVFDVSGGRATY